MIKAVITKWMVITGMLHGGFGTITDEHLIYRQEGEYASVQGSFRTGTVTSSRPWLKLPCRVDKSRLHDFPIVGFAMSSDLPYTNLGLVFSLKHNGRLEFWVPDKRNFPGNHQEVIESANEYFGTNSEVIFRVFFPGRCLSKKRRGD